MEKLLFWLCWIAYFSTYIGRLNYSASLTGIILSEGFSKGQAGMIGTAFFFAYGAGQFVSGFLGDRLAPKKMVFTGLMVSGLCNLAMAGAKSSGLMTAVWCVNGLFQAFIWSPMIRLMYEYYKTETRMKACVSLNSSVPLGTMAAYGACDMAVRLEDHVRSGRRGADRYLAVLDYRHEAGGAVCGRIRENGGNTLW